ncbi:MAG: alanine racemase [Candidatus Bathyarchaeota archaeon]|nr:alanine racemase [Candidatus Bathyarchaeota archaeon]
MNAYFNGQPSPEEILERVKGFQSWLEIDLDAIGHNLDQVTAKTGNEVIPCVKSNAYGHGVVPVVSYMMTRGVNRVLVAKLHEALQLREAGLDLGIVSIDPLFTPEQFETVVKKNITHTVYQRKAAEALSDAAVKLGKTASVWVKLDTGLGRVGVRWTEAVGLIEYIHGLPNLRIDGVFSTMSEEEALDQLQVKRILAIEEMCAEKGISVGTKSIASSNAIFHKPYTYLDAVRPGLMLLGFYPEEEDKDHGIELKQSLAWKARIEHVKTVEEGESLTYSRRFVAPKRMKVGTVHIGYYDGYPRGLTKKGKVKVGNEVRDVLGTVSVNHFLVDLTDTELDVGDTIEAISREGVNDALGVATEAGIMTYSLANGLHMLTPRIYIMDGKPVAMSKLKVQEE